jgi:hypothetical protein
VPSRKKGWKVLVFKYMIDDREFWWLGTLHDHKKRAQETRLLRSNKRGWRGPYGEPPLRSKAAHELTEQQAKRAFADAKRTGVEAKLVNPQGVTVRHVNKKERSQ